MGIFGIRRSRRQPVQQVTEHYSDPLVELTNLVTWGDDRMIRKVRQSRENLHQFYFDHESFYTGRGLSRREAPARLQWAGCMGLLVQEHYACPVQADDRSAGFYDRVSQLKGIRSEMLPVNRRWLDPRQGVGEWCQALEAQWAEQGMLLVCCEAEPGQQILFPCPRESYPALARQAAAMGQKMDRGSAL